MDRRTFYEDMKTELEVQTFNLFPERWRDLYFQDAFPNTISIEQAEANRELEAELPADIDELDEYYNNLGKKRRISGADVPDDFLVGMWR